MLISILQFGNTEVVELLLNTPGIDVNAKNNDGMAPLHLAAIVSSFIHSFISMHIINVNISFKNYI